MLRYTACLLLAAGIVSGQYLSCTGTGCSAPSSSTVNTDTATTVTTTTTAVPTAAPTLTSSTVMGPIDIQTGSSVTDSTSPSRITETFYYCTSSATFSAIGPFVTIFETVFIDICSTGITEITYIITDTCGCQHSTDYTRPTGCPSGFTVTEKTCTMCPGSSIVTVTTPISGAGQTTNAANPTTAISVAPISAGQTSSPQSSSNGQSNQIQQANNFPGSGSSSGSPSASSSTQSYQTTNDAKPAAGSSLLGLIMVMSTAVVAGLMCIL